MTKNAKKHSTHASTHTPCTRADVLEIIRSESIDMKMEERVERFSRRFAKMLKKERGRLYKCINIEFPKILEEKFEASLDKLFNPFRFRKTAIIRYILSEISS